VCLYKFFSERIENRPCTFVSNYALSTFVLQREDQLHLVDSTKVEAKIKIGSSFKKNSWPAYKKALYLHMSLRQLLTIAYSS